MFLKVKQNFTTVSEAYVDPKNMPLWMNGLKRMETVKGKFPEIGSIGKCFYDNNHILEDKLVAYEKCENTLKITSEVRGGGLVAIVSTYIRGDKDNDFTKINFSWSAGECNLLFRILLPFIWGKIKELSKKDMFLFKELVETKGKDFTK